MLQHAATYSNYCSHHATRYDTLQRSATHCYTLDIAIAHTLQHTAAHCNTLHTATQEKNKKNESKKKAHRGQSVRFRLWWKQGNMKMAVSEDHASCWVHKDLIVTTKQIQALLTAARASGGKDECQVRLTGIERKYWMGKEIGRLGGYGFRVTVTANTSLKYILCIGCTGSMSCTVSAKEPLIIGFFCGK